ncbi:MAG TPA: Ig-like domain-containing protein [Candidatus Saccharimonadales bacterium]|nr:Ig-like domain-containing protein [Candidatus Saccharimonadales bacterium]
MANKKGREAVPQFSYRQSLKKEEVKTYKRIALLLTGFFVVLLIIWFMGTNFINSLSFLSKGSDTPTTSSDQNTSLPLQTPTFSALPDAVNTPTIDFSGETSSEVSVALSVNGKSATKTKSDTTGQFKFTKVALTPGDNLIKVTATNSAGETKDASATVTLDTTKPGLAITSPVDGATYPSSTKTVTIVGATEPEAIVYINGSQAVVDAAGKFSFNVAVTPGTNGLEVSSTDSAGNITTVKLSVTVEGGTPASPDQ